MNIAALIGVMIAIVVGVNLIAPINSVVQNITEQAGNATGVGSSGIASLSGVLTIVFVVVIILGAVAWIGFDGFGGRNKKDDTIYTAPEPPEIYGIADPTLPDKVYEDLAKEAFKEEAKTELPKAIEPTEEGKDESKTYW